MQVIDKKIIARARREAKEHNNAPSDFYLCNLTTHVPAVGDRTAKELTTWDVFSEEQHGFLVATERIPLYPEEITVTDMVDWWRA